MVRLEGEGEPRASEDAPNNRTEFEVDCIRWLFVAVVVASIGRVEEQGLFTVEPCTSIIWLVQLTQAEAWQIQYRKS